MAVPSFDAKYGDLTPTQADPRYMRLCTQQVQELSALTAKHARERVILALAIRREGGVELHEHEHEHELPDVPEDWPVQPVSEGILATHTCGTCGRMWDDSVSTSMTPVPSGRCPFEPFHADPDSDERVEPCIICANPTTMNYPVVGEPDGMVGPVRTWVFLCEEHSV